MFTNLVSHSHPAGKAFFRTSYLVVLMLSVMSCCLSAATNNSVTMAVVAEKSHDLHKSPLVSLLEVELSRIEGVKLLERAEIEKILAEHQLSVAGLLDRSSAIKLGRLLRADAFLLLSAEDSKNRRTDRDGLLRTRLVETAHGLRLWDGFEPLDAAKFTEIARRVTDEVRAAAEKLTLPAGHVIPVGIVDVHRVQLGESHRLLARAMPGLLSARLSKEPKIIMLERENLNILRQETLLTEGEDADFWNSAVLIEGYIEPDDGKQLRMNLRIKRASGDKIAVFTVSIEPDEPSVAVDNVAAKMIRKLLDAPPAISWEPVREAEEFFQQGQLLYEHGRYADAIEPLETAHAMQAGNVFYIGAVLTNEWHARYRKKEAFYPSGTGISYYSDLELAELVSILVRRIRDRYEDGSLSLSDIYSHWARPGRLLGAGPRGKDYFTNPASVSTEQVKRINRGSRRIWIEMMDKALKQKLLDERYPQKNRRVRMQLAWASSDEPEELMANFKNACREYRLPLGSEGKIISAKERIDLNRQALQEEFHMVSISYLDRTHLKDSSEEFLKLWRQYLNEPDVDEDALAKFNRYVGLMRAGRRSRDEAEVARVRRYCFKALEVLQKELKTPDEPFSDYEKQKVRRQMKHCLMDPVMIEEGRKGRLVRAWEGILAPLIEAKDVKNLTLWGPDFKIVKCDLESKGEIVKRYYRLFGKIAMVLEAGKSDKYVQITLKHVKDAQALMLKYRPDLAVVRKPSSLSVTMLLHSDGESRSSRPIDHNRYLRTRLPDKTLWIANLGSYQSQKISVELVGINLVKKKVVARYQTETPRLNSAAYLTDMAVGEERTYLSINNLGLVEFPGSRNRDAESLMEPRVLTNEDSLPSTSITSIARSENGLFVAYGGKSQESGLGLYDPRAGRWEGILCSAFKGEAPFNAGLPYRLYNLTLMPPDRLFFVINDIEFNKHTVIDDWKGLWKMNIKTRVLKYFRNREMATHLTSTLVAEIRGKWWLWSRYRDSAIIEFDPDLEEMKSIGWDPYPGLDSYSNLLSTGALHNGRFWGRWGRSQIIVIPWGAGVEEAQIVDNNILDGHAVCNFMSTPYGLVAIGDGTVGLVETGAGSQKNNR